MLVSKAFAGRTHRGIRSSDTTRHFGAKTNARTQAPVFDANSHKAPYHGKVRRGRNRCFARLCRNSIAIEIKLHSGNPILLAPRSHKQAYAPSSALLDYDCTSLHPPPGFSLTRFWFALRRPLHRQHSRRRPLSPCTWPVGLPLLSF